MRCNVCKFETGIKTNFRKHLSSITHKSECRKMLVCDKCLLSFANNGSFTNHINACDFDLCPKKFKKINREISLQETKPQIVINQITQYNNCTFKMSINDLIRDPFTTSNHKLILEQMKREKSDIYDYLIEIDNDIQKSIDAHNIQQAMDLRDGYIKNIKEFKIPILLFFSHVMVRLCQSTRMLVVTHRDLTIDGADRELLFKHDNNLHSDLVIKELIKQSRHSEIIEDDNSPLPAFPREYNDLLVILYQQAMRRKNEHNRNIMITNARRD